MPLAAPALNETKLEGSFLALLEEWLG